MSAIMTDAEIEAFLQAGRPFAAVGTLRRDGRPFVTPLGFIYEDAIAYFSVARSRSFITRVGCDPRICCTVFNDRFPTVWAMLEGNVDRVDDLDDEISRRIDRRYMHDAPVGFESFERNWLAAGRVVYRLVRASRTRWDTRKKRSFEAEAGVTIAEAKQ